MEPYIVTAVALLFLLSLIVLCCTCYYSLVLIPKKFGPPTSPTPPPNRRLFQFTTPTGPRFVDPFEVHRALIYHPTLSLEAGETAAQEGTNPEADQFIDHLAICFHVSRYKRDDCNGLTDQEILAVYDNFAKYIDTVKKNIENSRPSSSPSPASSTSPTPQPAPTSYSSASG